MPRDTERLAIGQWFTPPAVADLALGLALPPDVRRARVLDPTCGDGVFLARARARGVPASQLTGIELDPEAAAAARHNAPGADIRCADLFDVDPDVGPDAVPAAPGYDAIVGNPPYVRQERLSGARKARIRQRLRRDFPDVGRETDRLVGRGDLAVACIARALRLIRPGGRIALVVSSALVDAAYAAPLWALVARVGRVRALIEAPGERWFADAAVNAMIAVIEVDARAGDTVRGSDDTVIAARLRVPTEEAARRGVDVARLAEVARVRHVPASRPERWGAALRAADAWFAYEAAAAGALVPLGEVADVQRGVTSGANDVFYLPRARADELEIEPAALAPLVRAPRSPGRDRIALDPDATPDVAVVVADEAALARLPGARRYLEAHAHVASRQSVRNRRPWWALPARPARLLLTKAYASRFIQRLASAPVIADQRVYAVYPRPGTPAAPGVDIDLLAAVLNATFTAFALESLGRASMGEGALEWTVADAHALPILDPRRLSIDGAARVRCALAELAARPIGVIDAERDRADRRALDRAVLAVAPAAAELLDEIWPALIDAVARRNARRQQRSPVAAPRSTG